MKLRKKGCRSQLLPLELVGKRTRQRRAHTLVGVGNLLISLVFELEISYVSRVRLTSDCFNLLMQQANIYESMTYHLLLDFGHMLRYDKFQSVEL